MDLCGVKMRRVGMRGFFEVLEGFPIGKQFMVYRDAESVTVF
jgi:hypothetical protein